MLCSVTLLTRLRLERPVTITGLIYKYISTPVYDNGLACMMMQAKPKVRLSRKFCPWKRNTRLKRSLRAYPDYNLCLCQFYPDRLSHFGVIELKTSIY